MLDIGYQYFDMWVLRKDEGHLRDDLVDTFDEEELMFADGFDDAILGVCSSSYRVIYSVEKMIKILMASLTAIRAEIPGLILLYKWVTNTEM